MLLMAVLRLINAYSENIILTSVFIILLSKYSRNDIYKSLSIKLSNRYKHLYQLDAWIYLRPLGTSTFDSLGLITHHLVKMSLNFFHLEPSGDTWRHKCFVHVSSGAKCFAKRHFCLSKKHHHATFQTLILPSSKLRVQ